MQTVTEVQPTVKAVMFDMSILAAGDDLADLAASWAHEDALAGEGAKGTMYFGGNEAALCAYDDAYVEGVAMRNRLVGAVLAEARSLSDPAYAAWVVEGAPVAQRRGMSFDLIAEIFDVRPAEDRDDYVGI